MRLNNKLMPGAWLQGPGGSPSYVRRSQRADRHRPEADAPAETGHWILQGTFATRCWYRGPFEHNGSVATLEDWFDERRLRDDYVPAGFASYGVKARDVRGHDFGLKLPAGEKKALIAFLKTL